MLPGKCGKNKMLDFYRGKKILVTGHTGFKGSWLCKVLLESGADVAGYSLEAPTFPDLYSMCGVEENILSVIGDVKNYDKLFQLLEQFQPEIVFHLAAQPIVRESYKDPRVTYETNIMGTVNICEAVRCCKSVKSFVNVTTDKVYQNNEWEWGYRENESLDGYDPYSNSKSCSDLITHCYIRSFYSNIGIAASTARAGNVIGGGDFAIDRIIPDCVRAVKNKKEIEVRNPYSTRPYQHVLEPLSAYLLIAEKQYYDPKYSGCYNVGPDESDCITTGRLADLFCSKWGEGVTWIDSYQGGPHEANFLKLDCSKIKNRMGWHPKWNVEVAIEKTVEWYKMYLNGMNINECMNSQIREFFM